MNLSHNSIVTSIINSYGEEHIVGTVNMGDELVYTIQLVSTRWKVAVNDTDPFFVDDNKDAIKVLTYHILGSNIDSFLLDHNIIRIEFSNSASSYTKIVFSGELTPDDELDLFDDTDEYLEQPLLSKAMKQLILVLRNTYQ